MAGVLVLLWKTVQFVTLVTVPPLNALCVLLDFFRGQPTFLFM